MIIILSISQAIISVLLTLLILIQNKDEGFTSMSSGNQSFQVTRRGAEKVIFNATVILAVLFIFNALSFVFFK